MKALVIIPTFNEKENISSIIQAVFSQSPPFHVLVIDDGSPDGTAGIVKQLQEINSDRLFLIERTGKLGLGTAYILGFQWAIQMGYDFVFEMDADFSHNPNYLPRLLQACINGADVAIGSRYVPGGKIENWPLDRHIYSKGGAFYTRLITGIPVKDPTAGFVCYRRTALEAIDLPTIQFIGYAFQIEMKFKAWKLGLKIVEVPIVFVDRKAGASKMTKGIIQEGVIGVWKMHQENKKQQ